MTCIGALLVRNEAAADRYLKRVLANAASFCSSIVVVDDCSTDDTASICKMADKVVEVVKRDGVGGWWGVEATQSEAPARKQLWDVACKHAGADGWVYVFDADHELLGITPTELSTLLKGTYADAWACPLWDCWENDMQHRVDGYWQAWRSPRPWLFKALPGEWPSRAIHVGHSPVRNWNVGIMPQGAGIRHLGYVKPQHRLLKASRYLILNSTQEPTWTPSSAPQKKHTPVASLIATS